MPRYIMQGNYTRFEGPNKDQPVTYVVGSEIELTSDQADKLNSDFELVRQAVVAVDRPNSELIAEVGKGVDDVDYSADNVDTSDTDVDYSADNVDTNNGDRPSTAPSKYSFLDDMDSEFIVEFVSDSDVDDELISYLENKGFFNRLPEYLANLQWRVAQSLLAKVKPPLKKKFIEAERRGKARSGVLAGLE